MDFIYDKIKINYETYGDGEAIIILHGWGRSIKDFLSLTKLLSLKYKVYLIDLPGFGKSEEPIKPYSLENYVLLLEDFIKENKINSPIIIGHSFGGRIGIRYATNHDVRKMILISSAGIKRFSLKTNFKIMFYKIKKQYFLKFNKISAYEKLVTSSGSHDYLNASSIMKKTLSNIVRYNQKKELKLISCEVLLIWGKVDCATPYKDALLMKKKIKNAGLVTLSTGHFAFLEEEKVFHKVIAYYLNVGDQ